MANLNLLIKPASSKCNINCTYCFYKDVALNREIGDYGFMSIENLEILIKRSIDYVDNGILTISFQGGEPLLIGLPFFQKLILIVNKYNKNSKIYYSMQTNGLLIDKDFARFFKEHNFLLGISLDGYKDTHNQYRKTYDHNDTYKDVLEKIKILDEYKVDYNILTVVTPTIAKHITKVYNTYKKNGFNFLQFIIPIPNFNEVSDFALTNDMLYEFLNTSFKLWSKDFLEGNYISIRYFDNLIHGAMGNGFESCNMQGKCTCQFVVESNLDTYPCDFYVLDEHRIGNFKNHTVLEMLNSSNAIDFINESLPIPEKCKGCKYYGLCRNGCKRERHNNENLYCTAYKRFFTENEDLIKQVCLKLQRG